MDMQLLLTFRIGDHVTQSRFLVNQKSTFTFPPSHSAKIKATSSPILCLFVCLFMLFKPYYISSTFSVSGKCSHDKEPGNSIYCLFSPYISPTSGEKKICQHFYFPLHYWLHCLGFIISN